MIIDQCCKLVLCVFVRVVFLDVLDVCVLKVVYYLQQQGLVYLIFVVSFFVLWQFVFGECLLLIGVQVIDLYSNLVMCEMFVVVWQVCVGDKVFVDVVDKLVDLLMFVVVMVSVGQVEVCIVGNFLLIVSVLCVGLCFIGLQLGCKMFFLLFLMLLQYIGQLLGFVDCSVVLQLIVVQLVDIVIVSVEIW